MSRSKTTTPAAPVLVTGAAGFIGSHVVSRLLVSGRIVIGVDDLSAGTLENLDPGEVTALRRAGATIHFLTMVAGKSTTSTLERLSGGHMTDDGVLHGRSPDRVPRRD